jgi:hypothetical protein
VCREISVKFSLLSLGKIINSWKQGLALRFQLFIF